MERGNSFDELAFRHCVSQCFLFAPEQETKKIFLNPKQKMPDDDFEKLNSQAKDIQNELYRRKLHLQKGV